MACRNIFQVCAFLSSTNNYQFRFRICSEFRKYLNTRLGAFNDPPQNSPYRRTYHYIKEDAHPYTEWKSKPILPLLARPEKRSAFKVSFLYSSIYKLSLFSFWFLGRLFGCSRISLKSASAAPVSDRLTSRALPVQCGK